jgi:transposase
MFTPEACARLLARVELGVSFEEAATAAGVKVNTAKAWLARGRREDSGAYAAFAADVEAARAVARARPAPMDAAELARVVSELARAGSVAAAKLRWEMLREAAASAAAREPVPVTSSTIDQLAARRRAGETT